MMTWRKARIHLVPAQITWWAEYPAAYRNGLTARGPGDPPNKLPDRE